LLSRQNVMTLGKKARGKQSDVATCRRGVERLEGNGVRTIMVDDNMAIVDEEGMCRRKITRVDAGKGVVKEFIRAGGILKRRNLEDQGKETTKGRHRGVAGRGGNTRLHRLFDGVNRQHRGSSC